MKYSQVIGIIACLAVLAVCYLPWSYIPSINVMLSGVNGHVSEQLYLGRPLSFYLVFSPVMILFFVLPKIWAKRTNVFLAAIVLGYSIYNYLLFSFCREGECPEKKIGIYLLLVCTITIQVMAFLPRMAIKENKD